MKIEIDIRIKSLMKQLLIIGIHFFYDILPFLRNAVERDGPVKDNKLNFFKLIFFYYRVVAKPFSKRLHNAFSLAPLFESISFGIWLHCLDLQLPHALGGSLASNPWRRMSHIKSLQ